MIAYVILNTPKIEKLKRRDTGGRKKGDMLPETLAAIKAAGFKPSRWQGQLMADHSMIRGEVADESVVLKIREIPFVLTARKIG